MGGRRRRELLHAHYNADKRLTNKCVVKFTSRSQESVFKNWKGMAFKCIFLMKN